jgi:hypothetical protein
LVTASFVIFMYVIGIIVELETGSLLLQT